MRGEERRGLEMMVTTSHCGLSQSISCPTLLNPILSTCDISYFILSYFSPLLSSPLLIHRTHTSLETLRMILRLTPQCTLNFITIILRIVDIHFTLLHTNHHIESNSHTQLINISQATLTPPHPITKTSPNRI